MKLMMEALKNNRMLIFWFLIFLFILIFKTSESGNSSEHLIAGIWNYLVSTEFAILMVALGSTLSVAFPVSLAILLISLFLACLSYFKPKTSWIATFLVLLSLLPSVYFIFFIKVITGNSPDNKGFLIFALTFSNLILFFFFMGFRKVLHEEFAKEYHHLAAQLGERSILKSSLKKIGLILMERFPPLFILVFSSTVFAEHKLDVSGGIYYLFYRTATFYRNRPDMFYGQLVFIFLFVVLFLVLYDFVTHLVKRRYY